MALDDSQILVQSFSAAKELIKRGSLSADDKVILGSYPQETYHHKDSPGGKDESKEGEFNLLFYAIKTRNYDAFTEILPRSDVSWQNSIGNSALLLAVRDKLPEYVEALLINGADASPRLKDDFTPLHSAAYNREPKIAQLLVQYNAKVNAKVKRSMWTPLHCAIMKKNEAMVSLLIEYGADPEAKAQKRDISNGAYLTCDQLAEAVGFAKYEQVKTDALVTMLVNRVTAQIKRKAKEKEKRTEATIPNASVSKNEEEPLSEAGSQKQDGNSSEMKNSSGHLAEEGKVSDKEKTTHQGTNSGTGVTEKSDQIPAASSHVENTKVEQRDVKSWMKNYKQKRTSAKTNPGEQQKTGNEVKTEKAEPKATSSSNRTPQKETAREGEHQHRKEKEPNAEQTQNRKGNKVENEQEKRKEEMGEKSKDKQTREARRKSGESGEELENRDTEDSKSNKGDAQAPDRQEQGRMDREDSDIDATTNNGEDDGLDDIWPGIRGTVEAKEDKSEEGCIMPDNLDRSACFSCPACQYDHEERPGGFFVNLSEAEDHVRSDHGVSEDVYGSINLPEERQSLTPFKCKVCQTVVLCLSEQHLHEHMESTHSKFHASKAKTYSMRVCRFCLKLLEQEKECSDSECKSLIESFANSQEQSNGQEKSNAMSFILLIGAVIAILVASLMLQLHSSRS